MGIMDRLFGGGERETRQTPPGNVRDYYRFAKSQKGAGPEPTATGIPEFQWDRLSGGDYDRLEGMIAEAPLRRLGEEKDIARDQFMAEMRTRGMADDPAAYQLWGETGGRNYTNAMSDVLSGAATTRYGAQANELAQMNPARMTNEWLRYQSPRDFWLNKMKTYYGGMGYTGQQSQAGGAVSSMGGGAGIAALFL